MAPPSTGIEIAAVLGTARPGNYTGKALDLVLDELNKQGAHASLIDAGKIELGLPEMGDMHPTVQHMKETVERATGVILATPEYHGSFSAAMKMIIENLGFPSVLGGKPVALLGVAAGRIGAIKSLEQLRGVCSHVGAIVLPGPVSIAGVRGVFAEAGTCKDAQVEKQIRGLATAMLDYVRGSICPRFALEQMVRAESA
ncbi:MAG: NADPH-dependent FMN reductase [Gemmatimonadales bacterium]